MPKVTQLIHDGTSPILTISHAFAMTTSYAKANSIWHTSRTFTSNSVNFDNYSYSTIILCFI